MQPSQYLAQALQSLAAPAQASQPGADLQAMAAAAGQRKDWEAANPGQSYGQHLLSGGMGAIQGLPGVLFNAPQAALGGLFALGRKAG